jgi:hypothetical protein
MTQESAHARGNSASCEACLIVTRTTCAHTLTRRVRPETKWQVIFQFKCRCNIRFCCYFESAKTVLPPFRNISLFSTRFTFHNPSILIYMKRDEYMHVRQSSNVKCQIFLISVSGFIKATQKVQRFLALMTT